MEEFRFWAFTKTFIAMLTTLSRYRVSFSVTQFNLSTAGLQDSY